MEKIFSIILTFWLGCIGAYTYAGNVYSQDADSTIFVLKNDSSEMRYVRIDKIFITGNEQTKPSIIMREMSIKEGDIFYLPDLKAALEVDKNKLINTKLFNTVKIHLLERSDLLVDLIIEVRERWYTFPIPILSIADRNFNDWIQNHDAKFSRINYGLRFYQYNVRGRNERLRGIVQFGFTKKFELSYRIPYINAAQKTGLTLYSGYAENKNIAYRTLNHKLESIDSDDLLRESFFAGLNLSRRSSFYNTQNFFLGYRSNTIDDTVAYLNEDYLLNGRTRQQYFELTYEFNRDKRDIQAYPLSGYQFTFSASKLGLGIFNDIDQVEFRANYGKYFDLGKQFYLSTSLTAKVTAPEKQPYINFQGLGYGRDFIRGYELYVIEGQHYLINKLNFKKRLFAGSANIERLLPLDQFEIIPFAVYFKVFFDSGTVNNTLHHPENTLLTNEFIFGGGVGLDIVTFYDTVIRLEYSINKQKERGFFFHFRSDI